MADIRDFKFGFWDEVESTSCSSTVVPGPSYNYTQTILGSTSLPPFYLSETYDNSVVRICDGNPFNETCVFYAISCSTTTTTQYVQEQIDQINWNGVSDNVNKVVYNGDVVFQKDIPTLTLTDYSYNSSYDRLYINYSLSETFVVGQAEFWYDDDTGLSYYGIIPLNSYSTGTFTVYDASSKFGTGTQTFYAELRYEGQTSNRDSITINIPVSGKVWSTRADFTSAPNFSIYDLDLEVSCYTISSASDAEQTMESAYPADNYGLGTLAVVWSQCNDFNVELEVVSE